MTYTFTADAAITQGAIVKLTGDFTVDTATAATDKAIGVAEIGANAGDTLSIKLFGDIIRGYAGGTIAAGDNVVPTTAGDVVKAASGDVSRLLALEPASTGDELRMMVETTTAA